MCPFFCLSFPGEGRLSITEYHSSLGQGGLRGLLRPPRLRGASHHGTESANAVVGFSHIESYITLEAETLGSFLCSLLCTFIGG